AQVESRLVEYKEREVKYCEKIKNLEFYNESNNECIEILKKKLETLKEEKEGVDGKLASLLKALKDLDKLIECRRPSPTVESTSGDDQNKNHSVFETVASPITPKPFIKFVKPKDSKSKSKIGKTESPKKPPVKKRVRKSFTPKPVDHRPYRPSQRPVKTKMNGARPNRTSFNRQAHSYANKPFHRTSAVRSPYRAPWVPTVNRSFPPVNRKFSAGSRNFPTTNRKFPTASKKFPTGSTKCSTADIGMKGKVVKPSACSFCKPSQNLSNKGPKNNSGSSQNNIDDKGYWDNGCSRHMTGNISYLSDFEPFDGGYVSVECIVLEREFKLLDDANILLNTPMQHNMYSIDLNNIVPRRDLTCLVAKASADECILWHRRLEFSSSKPQDHCSTKVPEGSGNPNPTASTSNPPADQMETLTVETPIPT
nr:ribonuclease H-like domain-containing protein [Tanacetum cinerariifolium]